MENLYSNFLKIFSPDIFFTVRVEIFAALFFTRRSSPSSINKLNKFDFDLLYSRWKI